MPVPFETRGRDDEWMATPVAAMGPPAETFGQGETPLSHVLVLLPQAWHNADLLVARLGNRVRLMQVENERQIPCLAPVDVAILHANRVGIECSPLIHDPHLGMPELVFLVDEAGSAQYLALRSRGFQHVVAQQDLLNWLPTALPRLVTLARARRILLRACADGSRALEAPMPSVRRPRSERLHAAETSFRSTYMRAILAEHGSRRRAAEEAGVPYRSFCEMLRKLGI
jgi:hypothetical protein